DRQQVLAVEAQPVGGHHPRRTDEAQDRATRHRLSRAAFADDAQPLAAEREGDAAHHLHRACRGGEAHAQVLHVQQRFAHCLPPLLGSSTSRRPSPRKQKPSETMTMAKPGMVATHHWSRMKARPREIIAPHSGNGGCAPSPRKPRPAAVRMMPAISSVTRMMTEDEHSGRIWRRITRAAEAPCRRIAAMNSELRKVSVSARAMRA